MVQGGDGGVGPWQERYIRVSRTPCQELGLREMYSCCGCDAGMMLSPVRTRNGRYSEELCSREATTFTAASRCSVCPKPTVGSADASESSLHSQCALLIREV